MKFTKLLVLGTLLLVGSGVAKAVDGNVWQKPTIAAPEVTTFTNYEVDKTVYLYNVASHLFYTNGNNWATRASLIFATNGDGNGATKGQAIRGIKVEFTQTDAAKEKGDDVVELKDDVKGAGTMISAFADAWDGIWTDNNSNANRFWKVTASGDYYIISNVTTEPEKYLGWQGDFTDTRLYLIDKENAGTQWKMVEESVYNDWLAAVEGSGISFDDFNTAVNIYNAAMQLKEVLDKAEEIGADVTDQITVYNNTSSTLEELNTAIKSTEEAIEKRQQEQAQGNYENATVNNPVDVTSLFIKNPTFTGSKYDNWSGDAFGGYNPKENAEHYNKTYNTWQELTGLKEGVYRVNVHAFYRAGNAEPAYDNYKAGNEASKYAKIFAVTGKDSLSNSIASPFSAGLTEKLADGDWSSVTDAETSVTYFIPNNMVAADAFFSAGHCNDNSVLVVVSNEQLKIGVRKDKTIGGDWSIFDDFSLTYYGNGSDAYELAAKSISATLPDYSNLDESTIYTQSVMETYLDAKQALTTTTGKDAVKAAIATAQEAAAEIELNISLWQKYQNLCQKAKEVAANEEYNEMARESLADYEMDMQDNLNNPIMTNEELQALCDQIESDIDKAIRAPKDGADVTDYLVNPDFSTNDDTGWTGRSTITDIAHSCAEAYEKKNFDFYQVVENAPLGVYEISLKGFVRNGANDAAWPAYRDNGAPEATAFVYMNQKQTPLKNCYDEKFPASYFDLSDGHIYGPTPYALLDAQGDSLRNDAGESLWVPNGMSTSQDVFDKGYYQSSAFGLVAKAGDKMQIGIKGSLGSSCWAIWDDFRLIYRGFQRDVVLEVLNEEIANVEGYKSLRIGKNVRDIIDAKLADAVAAKDFEKGQDMFDALTELFTVGDTVRASQAIFAELETIYEKLDPAIKESQAALSLIQEATNLLSEVSNNVIEVEPAAVTWTDDKAKETIAAIEQMIKDLAKPAGYADASDADPKDATWCIVNPKYADNTNEGWTSTATAAVNYNLCEVYNADFTYYQDIELSAGTYTLTAPGFYRFGSASEDYAAYNEDATQNNNLSMYVTVGSDSLFVAMPRLASAAKEYTADVKVADDKKSFDAPNGYVWVADPEANADSTQATGYIVVNNMEQAANEFTSGKYAGTTITFKVPEDMTVRIGMSKDVQQSTNWCIWGAWQLTYYGKNSTKEPTETGIATAFSNGQVARTEFFSINGTRISAPRSGVVIMKQTMSNGTIKVRKVIMK